MSTRVLIKQARKLLIKRKKEQLCRIRLHALIQSKAMPDIDPSLQHFVIDQFDLDIVTDAAEKITDQSIN